MLLSEMQESSSDTFQAIKGTLNNDQINWLQIHGMKNTETIREICSHPDEFTPRLRVSSGSGRTLGSPEAQLGQTSSRSNLGQIASPTDRIAGAFNARIA